MREIKFRAIRVFTGTIGSSVFIYSSLLRLDEKSYRLNLGGEWCKIDSLGQFTGMLDKNGKEIYEGDILKDKYGITATAHWYGSGFEFINTSGMMESGSDWEVIGNIFENKDLLEGGN